MDIRRQLVVIQVLASYVGSSLAYTCSYVDVYSRLHYVYCPHSDCCGLAHHRYCCSYTNTPTIIGGVLGVVIFIIIVTSILSCCCCACCPVYTYRRRSYGSYVTTSTTPVITVESDTRDYRATGTVDVVITDTDPYYREPEPDVIVVDNSADTYPVVEEYYQSD